MTTQANPLDLSDLLTEEERSSTSTDRRGLAVMRAVHTDPRLAAIVAVDAKLDDPGVLLDWNEVAALRAALAALDAATRASAGRAMLQDLLGCSCPALRAWQLLVVLELHEEPWAIELMASWPEAKE